MSAAGTESGSVGHLRSALWAGKGHGLGNRCRAPYQNARVTGKPKRHFRIDLDGREEYCFEQIGGCAAGIAFVVRRATEYVLWGLWQQHRNGRPILPGMRSGSIGDPCLADALARKSGRLTGRGWAIAGLVLGYAGVAATIAVIVAVFLFRQNAPTATLNQQMGTETSAVAAVRTLNTAEIAYAQAHPDLGYTCSLSELAGSWGVSGELAGGQKNGYVFKVQGCSPAKTNGPIAKYQVVAYPAAQHIGANPAFCSNESDVIKIARNGSPQDCLNIGVDLSDNEINHPQGWSKTSSIETAHP